MKRDIAQTMPFAVRRSMEKFGADIRIARLKRGLTAEEMADSLSIHRTTYAKIEAGDATVAIGTYAKALYALGFGTPLDEIVDPRNDEEGLLLDLQRLPKRVRAHRQRPFRFNLQKMPAQQRPSSEGLLRIGILAVMSGPAAAWGMVNKHCAEVTAEMYNEAGGIDIGGKRYRIEIVCFDDQLAPMRAAEGARQLIEEHGIRYIIGPNVEQTFAAALPVAEKNRAMLFPYSFTRALYRPPRENAVLGQIAGYQAIPFIYRYLMETEGVETISVVAPGTPEGLRQRQDIAKVAAALGMRILSESSIYRYGADDIEAMVAPAITQAPDLLALPNVAPLDAARLIRRARELGFRGFVTTESAQDVDNLIDAIGPAADGLVMVGGASPPSWRSPRMNDFIQRFVRATGSWNDEAGTKAYALEFVLATLQMAGISAIDDIDRFKSVIPHFSMDNPLTTSRSAMAYYGAREFSQKRQIGIPLVVNTIRNSRLETLFAQTPEEILV